VALVAASLVVVPAVAAESDLVVEGWSGSSVWSVTTTATDLTAAVPDIEAAGTLNDVVVTACDDGWVSEVMFSGESGDATVSVSTLVAALGWSSASVFALGLGGVGEPGCWSEAPEINETRRVRIGEITINDGAGGDGDGIVECAETVVIGVEIASRTDTVTQGQVSVAVLGTEASLQGPSWAPIPDLVPGASVVASTGFSAVIDSTVTGSDWLTLDVTIGSADAVYTTHRHIPIVCGVTGSADVSPRITFPVAGPNRYKREWLTAHNPAIHVGVDIFASRMVPVVAMADGVVSDVNWEHDPYHEGPTECCAVAIIHDSGWESWYLHLNNDTPGTDDGLGWGVMPGIVRGTRVTAGQIIGFIGDSTNAEATAPHTHVELHNPAGNPVDPYDYLVAAAATDPVCTATESECFPFVITAWNSRDPEVWVVQNLLAQSGFPAGTVDGVFGTRTDQAVRDFQEAAGLDVDGLVDEVTWDELHRVVAEGIDLRPDIIARLGDRGPIVIEIQGLLARAGHVPGPIDGIFGTRTDLAVRAFQGSEGLPVDGLVNDDTFEALDTQTVPAIIARNGDRGLLVIEVQSLLATAGFAPGPVDGIFGSQTYAAVRSFQSANGLPVDGVVGEATFAALSGDSQRVVIAVFGSRGPVVIEIQTLLSNAGFAPGPLDGIFGSLTQVAVRGFQASRGLPIDGVVDQATLNALS
jgi:peptidoglycan hydrolase-like protein with peptidoglycan-binding domain